MAFSPDTGPIHYYQDGSIYQWDTDLNQVDTATGDGEIYGGIDVQPDGTFYVGSGGAVAKWNPDGTKAWETSSFTGDYVDDILYEPTNNQVYAVGGVEVIAFDDTNGSTLWEVFPIGDPNSLTYDRWNDRIVAAGSQGTQANSIAALSPVDGSVVWGNAPDAKVDSVAAVRNTSQSRTEFVIHHTGSGSFHRVYADSGTYTYIWNQGSISAQSTSDFDSSGYTDGTHYYSAFPDDSTHKVALSDGTLEWRVFPANADSRGADVSPDKYGNVFASYRGQGIYKLDPADGSTITSASPSSFDAGSIAFPRYETFPDAWTFEPPFYYAGDYSGNFDKFALGGTSVLSLSGQTQVFEAEANPAGDEIYISEGAGPYRKYDDTGALLWEHTANTGHGMAVDSENGWVYIDNGSGITKLDDADGSVITSTSDTLNRALDISIDGSGNIYAGMGGTSSGEARSYDSTLTERWAVAIDSEAYGTEVRGGSVAFGTYNGSTYKFDKDAGTQTWRNTDDTSGVTLNTTISNDGDVTSAGTSGVVRHMDSTTGSSQWTFTPPSAENPRAVEFVPADNNEIYVGDYGGNIYQLDGTGSVTSSSQPYTDIINEIHFEAPPTTVEQITASQPAAVGSMNTPVAAFTEPLTATQVTGSGSMNATDVVINIVRQATQTSVAATQADATLSSYDVSSTQTAASATPTSPDVIINIVREATQPSASASANAGSLSSYTLTGQSVAASASPTVGDVSPIEPITATVAAASASQNDTVLDVLLNASQPSAAGSMEDPLVAAVSALAAQPTTSALMNGGRTFGIEETLATPTTATATANNGVIVRVRLQSVQQSNNAAVARTANTAAVGDTHNVSTITRTVNEVN